MLLVIKRLKSVNYFVNTEFCACADHTRTLRDSRTAGDATPGFLPASATAVSVDSRPGTSGVLPPSSGVPLEPDFTSERVSSDPQLFGANSMAPSWAR